MEYELGFVALLFKLFTAGVALTLLFAMGKAYDRKHDVEAKAAFNLVERDAMAFATYSGLRLIAFAIVVGWVFA